MGAKTTVYVKVLKTVEAIIEVSALGLSDAQYEAMKMPGVVTALRAAYNRDELDGSGGNDE